MKNLFKQYLPYLLGYKRQFIFAIIGMIAVALGIMGTAQMIKLLLDDIFLAKDANMLIIMPFIIIALFLLKGIGHYIQTYYMSVIGLNVVRKLRDNLVTHLTYQDIGFFQKIHSNEILSRVTHDIGHIQNVVMKIIPDLIRDALTIIALTGYLIYESPQLAFYFLIMIFLILYPLNILSKKMKHYTQLSQESTLIISSHLDEIFSNIKAINANSSQKFESQKFAIENQNIIKHLLKQIKIIAFTFPIMEILGSVAIALVMYLGGKEVIQGNMTMGAFFAFSVALFMLYTPIKHIFNLYNHTQDAIVANERMVELLHSEATIKSGEIELTEEIKHLSIMHSSLKYGEKEVLNNVSVGVDRGESIVLVGDAGAGKSSLLNLLVRFYDPSEGEILINEKFNLKDLTLDSLHQKVAYVPQSLYLFNDSIAQNVAYGQAFDKIRVKEALTKAHALEFIEGLEYGINTILTKNGNNLSTGQKQRIALARALYKNPDILILDESTSAIDKKSEALIQKALEALKHKMITITVTHKLTSIENSDAILVFKNGKILCRGQHIDLMHECAEYQKLMKVFV